MSRDTLYMGVLMVLCSLIARARRRYDNVFGKALRAMKRLAMFHEYTPEELEEVLHNTFVGP